MPSVESLQALCNILGLQFYIGPPKHDKNLIFDAQKSENKISEPVPAYAFDPDIDAAEHVLVPKLDIKLAAGHGSATIHERPVGMLAFRREWMQKYHIQPDQVSAVEVAGDSMLPLLNDGDTILVDHTRNVPKRSLVVTARVADDLFVKRLQQMDGGDWLLVSDNHDYAPLALGTDDAVIGEVVWQGR